MIFKTFDNDIDKWTAKIGVFGKSFNELGVAINKAFKDTIDEDISFWDALKNNLAPRTENGDSWIKNALGEIISADNINSYIEELDLDSAKDKLLDIFDAEKLVKSSQLTWEQYFDTLDDGSKHYIPDLIKNTNDLSKLTGDDLVKANQKARQAALDHNKALEQQTLSAKAGQIALKGLAIAGNMFAMWVVTKAIQLAAEAIDNYIHASEKAIEKTEELKSKHAEIASTYESHKKTVEDLTSSYEELAKGVDTATNTNLTLSDEDYKSYLDITDQLAEAFPTLRKTVDDNGHAILTLGQNGRTASEDLKELLQAEENLNNYKISQDISGLFGGVKAQIDEAKQSLEEFNEYSRQAEQSLSAIKNIVKNGLSFSEEDKILSATGKTGIDDEYFYALSTAVNNFKNSLSAERRYELGDVLDAPSVSVDENGIYQFYLNAFSLDEEEMAALQNEIKVQTSSIIGAVNDNVGEAFNQNSEAQQKAELAWKDFVPSLVATMKSKATFQELGDGTFGEDIQNFAIDLVSNLDSSVAEQMNENDPYAWVRDNIIFPLTQLDESDRKLVSETYKKLFELNPNDLSEANQTNIDNLIKTLAELLGQDEAELRLNLGFEIDEDYQKRYQNLVDKFGQDAVEKLTPEDLQIALTISTEEADKAIEEEKKKYEKLKAEFEDTGLQDVVDDYDNAVKSSKEYVDSLDDIYKSYNGINNIDRDILYWDDETLENNRQFLEEMYGSYEEAVNDLKGTWSTVLGTSENIDGVEIAYTQMLQTDHGLVTLTEDTFWDYFNGIFDQCWNEDGTFDAEKFIQLDAQGTDMLINGQMEHVANMIAAAEGQYMNGIKLTADDVVAIGSPGYDDDGNDLLPGNNSIFKKHSMHDVQAGALEAKYQLARVEEKAEETGTTVEGIWTKKDAIDDYADYGNNALQGLIKSKQELENPHETTIQWKNLDNLESKVNSIQSAYNTVTGAIAEYNKQGYLNMDTIDSLISLDDEYINKLVDENGQLQYNSETFKELARIKLEEAKASVYQEFCTELARIKQLDAKIAANELALANGTLTESAYETAKALYEEYIAMKDVDSAHKGLATNAWESAEKKIALLDNQLNNVTTSTYNFEKASKSSSSSAKKEYKEVFDFFERRIDILNNSLDLLKSNLENVNGSFAKNQLIDAQSSIYQEEIKNYTDALNMYQQKANEVLATLPDDIAEKIKNGSISLTTFMGESSEAVVDAMKDYEGWSDKIADCSQKLAELKETLRDLELEKFNNIIEDFTNQFDLRQTGIDNIDKQIALFEESGMLIGKSFYQAQREQATKQLDILKEQQKAMANQLSSALSSGNIEAGTDEWIEMVSELQNVEGSILDCKKAIEEFDNAILDLHWQVFERIQDQFSNLDSELDNLIGLLDDIDVADTSGNWTTDSITKLGLLTQQYELAQYNVAEYNKAIEELKEQYANGEYSAIEYADKLAELSDGMWENANAVEAVKDAIMDLHEARVDKEIEGIEEEIEAYNELIQAKIDELDAEKELNDYRNSISQKSKSITDLERQIAAMSNDTTAATVAQRKKLEEQLAEAKKELEDAEYDHSIQSQKDALNKQYEDYEKTRNDEIETLRDSLNNQEKLIADSFETVKQNASTIGQQISNIAKQHGVQVSNSLTSSWQAGENAIASYGTVLSAQSSAFIGNIMGVENEVWALQNQADSTAVSLAHMFSTQADNLVNELAESYYAEGNLLNITNALQSSLVNALERGYDISGITTALKGIENAANSAGTAIDKLFDKQNTVSSYTYQSAGSSYGSNVVRVSDSNGKLVTITTKEDAEKKYGATLKKYAKGTRNSKGNLIVKDEQGYELVLPKLASGKYAIENEGSQILTKVETDNIFQWAKFNPDMFIPQFANNFATPHITSKNVNNVAPSVNVGNLITVQGNVDSSNIKQMEIIANKAVNNLVDKMYNGKKYGSY